MFRSFRFFLIITQNAMRMQPRTPHTTNKTIRFPDDVIADVEAAIAGKDCTFSAFVIAAVRSALAQLAESPEA